MSRRRLPALKLLTIAVLAVLPAAAAFAGPQAQGQQDQRGDRNDNRQGGRATLSEAVRRAERDTRGEVLSAERVMNDGRELHRVKVVDDRGRVRVFTQDPQQRRDPPGVPPRPARDDDN
jgi:hypothetical protein